MGNFSRLFGSMIESGENIQGKCTSCKHKIKGRIATITNFLNHLKIGITTLSII